MESAAWPHPIPFLSLVIPAYNESDRLPETLRTIHTFLTEQGWLTRTEVIVVDDGSTDDTSTLAIAHAASWPQLHVLTLPHRGKGAAVRQGMLYAHGEYRFFGDADLAMPIDQIVRFLPPLGPPADVLIASRELPGSKRSNEQVYRHVMGRIFNHLVQWLLLPGLNDTQCGFKCFTAATANRLFSQQSLTGMGFDVEILALARLHGYRIVEIPIDWHNARDSRVRPITDTIAMVREIVQMRRRFTRLPQPQPDETSRVIGTFDIARLMVWIVGSILIMLSLIWIFPILHKRSRRDEKQR